MNIDYAKITVNMSKPHAYIRLHSISYVCFSVPWHMKCQQTGELTTIRHTQSSYMLLYKCCVYVMDCGVDAIPAGNTPPFPPLHMLYVLAVSTCGKIICQKHVRGGSIAPSRIRNHLGFVRSSTTSSSSSSAFVWRRRRWSHAPYAFERSKAAAQRSHTYTHTHDVHDVYVCVCAFVCVYRIPIIKLKSSDRLLVLHRQCF